MKTPTSLLPAALWIAATLALPTGAQTINNGQFVGGIFQMDITIPAGPPWILQSSPVLPAGTWTTLGSYSGFNAGVIDPSTGTASQRYYRLIRIPVPVVGTDCGLNPYGFIRKAQPPGFCMQANPLVADAGNSLNNLLPVMPDQTEFYQYSPASGWTLDTWDSIWPGWGFGPLLNPGQGCFIKNPLSTTITLEFIGTVQQGVLTVPVATSYNMISSKVPQAGLITTDLLMTPPDQTALYKFVCGFGYQIYVYDLSGVGGWCPTEPFIDVAESFWVQPPSPFTWTRIFNTCP